MNRFVGTVEKDWTDHGLMADGRNLLVAVSGGIDSVVLLEVLHRLSARHRWKLVIGHFNHQLRGRQSDADEVFVSKLAGRLGWPFLAGRESVRDRARAQGISIEMAAREARHQFLASAAARSRAPAIALAHHADDQTELLLLRLLRGAGTEGLGGMKWMGPSPANARLTLIRPLLARTRAEIEEFARSWSLPFRHDHSNDSTDILRNRVRKELIPLLRKNYQPRLTEVICRQAELLAADGEFVTAAARKWTKTQRLAFEKLDVAVQRRALVGQLIDLGVVPQFEKVEALRLRANAPIQVSGGGSIHRPEGRGVVKTPSPSAVASPRVWGQTLTLDLATASGAATYGNYRVSWRIREGRRPDVSAAARIPGREWFDADRVGRTVRLRTARPGDRFKPVGLGQDARLQNLLSKARMAREIRSEPLLAVNSSGEIWWVDGLRIGEGCKVTASSRRFLEWNWALK